MALDQSEPMLRAGGEPNRLAGLDDRIRARPRDRRSVSRSTTERSTPCPSPICLRYVDDPAATVRELARVLRDGRLDRDARVLRAGGAARSRWAGGSRPGCVMRLLGTAVSPAWARTAAFLGPNISRFVARHPLEEWVRWFQRGGDPARSDQVVPVRLRGRALGREGTVSEDRPAFYALAPGGWRDWWTLLHPPYTLWHLSYVALGAATAAELDLYRLGMSLLGFFLGVGLAAHALDELRGRPLGTSIPDGVLVGRRDRVALRRGGGRASSGSCRSPAWLAVFIVVGAFLVVAYNLELFGGAFHSDLWFALAWGGFPALTGAFAQDGTLERRGGRWSRRHAWRSARPSARSPRPCAASGAGSPRSRARSRCGTAPRSRSEPRRSGGRRRRRCSCCPIAMPLLAVGVRDRRSVLAGSVVSAP